MNDRTPCDRCRGTEFFRVSDKLLRAESLDPKDSVPMEACARCGKERRIATQT